MVSGRQVGQGVAVVVVLVVLNVLLFVRMSGNEHVSQPITELSRAPRSSLAVWGEQYAAGKLPQRSTYTPQLPTSLSSSPSSPHPPPPRR